MKPFLMTAALLSCACASASPGPDVVDTCLKTVAVSEHVKYVNWPFEELVQRDDEAIGREELVIRYKGQTVGVWTSKPRRTWGITVNDKDMPARGIVRLDKKAEPYEYNPHVASVGEIHAGRRRYICVTFNFDGIGSSGSYQNVRGIYLISRKPYRVYYTAGDIRSIKR